MKSKIRRDQSMNGSVSKTKKSELPQHPCLTEKQNGDETTCPRSQMESRGGRMSTYVCPSA